MPFLAFLTGGITRWLVLGALLFMGFQYLQIEHWKNKDTEDIAVYAKFLSDTKIAGLQAIADNKQKELDNAKRIADADDARDAALSKLRQSTYSGRRASTENPAAPAGSSKVCYDSKQFDAAFRQFGADLDQFISDARAIVVEGDAANIDAESLIESWPK